MSLHRICLFGVAAFSSMALAQSPDCPKANATMPMRPPQITQMLPPNAVFNAEEGHIAAIVIMERSVKPGPPPQDVASIASDISSTPLAQWRYEGYLPERVPHRVSRFFRSPDGAVLALGEWDYKPDVGDIQFPGMNNASVGNNRAGLFSLRSPSGCVSTTLSWKDDRKLYRIEIAGPLDMERQRATLMEIGRSLAH